MQGASVVRRHDVAMNCEICELGLCFEPGAKEEEPQRRCICCKADLT